MISAVKSYAFEKFRNNFSGWIAENMLAVSVLLNLAFLFLFFLIPTSGGWGAGTEWVILLLIISPFAVLISCFYFDGLLTKVIFSYLALLSFMAVLILNAYYISSLYVVAALLTPLVTSLVAYLLHLGFRKMKEVARS